MIRINIVNRSIKFYICLKVSDLKINYEIVNNLYHNNLYYLHVFFIP